MQSGEDNTTIGVGGWGLVVLSGAISFAVLRGVMHYLMLPTLMFSLAIGLIVLLLLHRLAAAVNRYDDEEEASRVRKIVPASAESGIRMGGLGASGAVAVPMRADTVSPQRPSSVVTPLARMEAPPVIQTAATAAAPVVEPISVVEAVAAPVAQVKAKAKTEPKPKVAKAKAEAKPKAVVKAKAEPKATPKPKAEKKPKVAKPEGLVRLTAPRDGKADALQEIEGIGPALEKLVNSLGFYHFDQIAGWTDADVALVDTEMKTFKGRIARDKWVEQARIIVAEGLDAFRKRAETNDY